MSITQDTTLVAVWEPEMRTITYRGTGATEGLPPEPQHGMRNSTVTIRGNLRMLRRTGFVFDGWNTNANGTGTTYRALDEVQLSRNLTLHPRWRNNTFSLAYVGNGSDDGTVPPGRAFIGGDFVPIARNSGELIRWGYTFVGWNTSADGTGRDFEAGGFVDLITHTILFAKWNPAVVNVTYHGNGSTGGDAPNNQTIVGRDLIKIRNSGTLLRSGHRFNGWNTEQDGTGDSFEVDQEVTWKQISQDTTLYAQWEPLGPVVVYYDLFANLSGSLSEAKSILDDVKPGFMYEFAIDLRRNTYLELLTLNSRPHDPEHPCGDPSLTGMCGVNCGDVSQCSVWHHRSGDHFLTVGQSTSTLGFRFVDFRICS
jgi:uncharacterized repeat protein (TIGR02543 family)